jgi:hypothetical protein
MDSMKPIQGPTYAKWTVAIVLILDQVACIMCNSTVADTFHNRYALQLNGMDFKENLEAGKIRHVIRFLLYPRTLFQVECIFHPKNVSAFADPFSHAKTFHKERQFSRPTQP